MWTENQMMEAIVHFLEPLAILNKKNELKDQHWKVVRGSAAVLEEAMTSSAAPRPPPPPRNASPPSPRNPPIALYHPVMSLLPPLHTHVPAHKHTPHPTTQPTKHVRTHVRTHARTHARAPTRTPTHTPTHTTAQQLHTTAQPHTQPNSTRTHASHTWPSVACRKTKELEKAEVKSVKLRNKRVELDAKLQSIKVQRSLAKPLAHHAPTHPRTQLHNHTHNLTSTRTHASHTWPSVACGKTEELKKAHVKSDQLRNEPMKLNAELQNRSADNCAESRVCIVATKPQVLRRAQKSWSI